MKFNLLNRRAHLYLAMFLLPWFLMYGVTSLPFNHNGFFRALFEDDSPAWSTVFDREYVRPVPEDEAGLRQFGAAVLEEAGLEGSFGTYRPDPRQIHIYWFTFWQSQRITYFVDEGRLLAEKRVFRWNEFLTSLHARGGYQQDSVLADAWAVVVDVISLGMIVWVASGLIMWWQLRRLRTWGAVALGSGVLVFVAFLWGM